MISMNKAKNQFLSNLKISRLLPLISWYHFIISQKDTSKKATVSNAQGTNLPMTYETLLEQLQGLSPKQLKMNVLIYDKTKERYYPPEHLLNYDKDHPYFSY